MRVMPTDTTASLRPSQMTPTITIVTPWLNHLEFCDGYWDAIEAGAPDEVIIVDNGSDPPLDFAAIRFEENRGFCAACNAGLHAATSDAVLFLNDDVELQTPGWLTKIRDRLEPKTLVGQQRTEQHAVVDGHLHAYIDGWCVAALTGDLVELGGWDETLDEPAYYSDNLLTLRALQAGWQLAHIGHLGLRHLGNGTSRDDGRRMRHAAANNRQVWEQAVREATVAA